jgi:hypothetical protein
VALRLVNFEDERCLVSWCKDCPCGQPTSMQPAFGRSSSSSYSHVARQQVLPTGTTLVCECAAQLIDSYLGEQRLTAELATIRQPGIATEGCLSVGLSKHSGFTAVCTEPGNLDAWGVVHSTGVCSTCDRGRHKCSHVHAFRGGQQAQPSPAAAPKPRAQPMTVEAQEKLLSGVLDAARNSRKLGCISRLPIPESPGDDPEVAAVYNGKAEGRMPLPAECAPGTGTVCPECARCDWGEPELEADAKGRVGGEPSLVILASAVVRVTFKCRRCQTPECSGVLKVDGRELALLRRTRLLAFGYCIMHRLEATVGTSEFPGFWGFFRQTLECVQNIGVAEKTRLFNAYRHAFQAAFLDYVQLHCIDYSSSFYCPHVAQPSTLQLVVDGIAIGYAKSRSLLWCPWAAAGAGAEGVVAGSKFSDRVFVRRPDTRRLLYDLACTQGLLASEVQSLRDGLGEGRQRALLPFLEAGALVALGSADAAGAADAMGVASRYRAAHGCKQLFMALGSSASACQIAQPKAWELLHKVELGFVLAVPEMAALSQQVPSLWRFISSHEVAFGGYPADVRRLVGEVVAVAEAAYVPQPTPGHVPEVRKTTELDKRVLVADGAQQGGAPAPAEWSREESFLRTGVWCSAGLPGGAADAFQKSQLGGSHVRRRLRDYLADRVSQGSQQRGAHACTKHKQSTRDLIPGLCLGWCQECRVCVFMAAMANAESPRTVFEVLYAMFDEAPGDIIYDNMCTLHHYVLNREPGFFKLAGARVDAMHYQEHTRCAPDFNSALYPGVKNSQLAEQKNAVLRKMGSAVFYMHQHTFLLFVRHWLHRMHRIEQQKRNGECFYA